MSILTSRYSSTLSAKRWEHGATYGQEFYATATEKMHGTNASILVNADGSYILMGRSKVVDAYSLGVEQKVYNTLFRIVNHVVKFDKQVRLHEKLVNDEVVRYPCEVFGDSIAEKYYYGVDGATIDKPLKNYYSFKELSGFNQVAIFFNFYMINDGSSENWVKRMRNFPISSPEHGLYDAPIVKDNFILRAKMTDYKQVIEDFESKPSPFMLDNFNVCMIPEGMVYAVKSINNENVSLFKIKGEKHSPSYSKNIRNKVSKPKIKIILTEDDKAYIKDATAQWRFNQFIDEIKNENDGFIDMCNMGDYLSRVMKDINKECIVPAGRKSKFYNKIIIEESKKAFINSI